MLNYFERLKEERERLGFNQTELGELGGVRKETQSNYETGKRSPDADYLAKVALAGVDVGYVLTGTRTPAKTREEPGRYDVGGPDPRRAAIMALVADLDGEGLDHVHDAAEMAQQIKALRGQVRELERKAG